MPHFLCVGYWLRSFFGFIPLFVLYLEKSKKHVNSFSISLLVVLTVGQLYSYKCK